ncbi:MAG: STN and carboxypeptidase regulatory-like domain-containing protein, partial [Bacteroidales bacterium]|nr:STN and carboxypeptidase regulatory-like domain-containing protein [Bacteroidales bacterium]
MHHNFQLFSKIQCLLYGIVFFFSVSQCVIAQESLLDKKITVNFRKIPLHKAFKHIEKQLSCFFTYESATVDNQKKISLSFKNISLEDALDRMLNDSSLSYKVVDNHVVIRKKYLPANKERFTDSIPEIITLRGKIVDEIDNQLLPFSSISLEGYTTGVIANAQGEFVFKLRKKYHDQKVCLAHLGYKNLCLSVEDMMDTNQTYKLERTFISIQEVIIRKTDARELIKAAIKKIDENYSTKPVYLTGFYRESIKRRDSYMFFSEAVVKIYKSAYTNLYEDEMVKVLKARKMENVTAQDTFAVKLKSGLSAALELDLVKNPLDFLKEENFGNYDYNMADIITYNDRNVYLIEFLQKEDVKEALYMGKIYI